VKLASVLVAFQLGEAHNFFDGGGSILNMGPTTLHESVHAL
jgi:hypothetical protein